MTAAVELLEALGSEMMAHLRIDAPPVLTDDTRELVRDLEVGELLERRASEGTSTFVARLDPRTTAQERQTIELVVETSRTHFFDPEDGSGIYED